MTITGLSTRLIKLDASPRYLNGIVPPGRPSHWFFPLVTVHTADGIDGWSSAYGPQADGQALVELLHESYYPQIAGLDAGKIEAIWQKLFRRQRHLYNQSDSLVGVIDVALWDILGKATSRSIAALLGQCVDRRPAYLSAKSEHYSEAQVAAEAAEAKRSGYHGYKLQLRDGPTRDIPRLRAARSAVGPDFRLMQDPNSSYTLLEALEVGRALDELAFHWYEEPLPEQQIENYRRLVEQLKTPILATETVRLTDIPNFIARGAMTIARGDVLIKGGVTGLKKAMAACELFGYNLEIHTANSPLLDLANLQVACAASNTTMLEVHHPIFRFALKQHPFDVGADGQVVLPTGAGLGAELDWAWIEQHTHSVRLSGSAP